MLQPSVKPLAAAMVVAGLGLVLLAPPCCGQFAASAAPLAQVFSDGSPGSEQAAAFLPVPASQPPAGAAAALPSAEELQAAAALPPPQQLEAFPASLLPASEGPAAAAALEEEFPQGQPITEAAAPQAETPTGGAAAPEPLLLAVGSAPGPAEEVFSGIAPEEAAPAPAPTAGVEAENVTVVQPPFDFSEPEAGVSLPPLAEQLPISSEQPPPGSQRSNFSSLISLLSPPPDFQMPQLTPQQQANMPQLKQLRQGIGTVTVRRNVGNFDGVTMACGMGYLSDYFAARFVGLPDDLFQNGARCGTCVRIWCVDSVCLDPLERNATFMVADSCRECGGQDLLVSAPGFENLTGVDINISPKLQIAWAFQPCAPLIQGGIKMLGSQNNSPNYLAFNFSNLKQLLRAVSIGGLNFQRTDYGFWEYNSPGQVIHLAPPYRLVLTSADGQTLVKPLQSLRSQDLGMNFQP